jgi:NAD-dependent DNA ligase
MICTSNFETEERENLELLIRLVGATYTPALKQRGTTHLICKRPEGPKYERAIDCDIRVVTVQWLEECVTKVSDYSYRNNLPFLF